MARIQPDWYVPRLLGMFRSSEYTTEPTEPVAWALPHPSGCMVTATLTFPPQVTLWASREQAEEALGAYVHDGQRSHASTNTALAAGGGEQAG